MRHNFSADFVPSRRVTSSSLACVFRPTMPYTTCAPTASRRSAQLMFASSSKRALSSTTASHFLAAAGPPRSAVPSAPTAARRCGRWSGLNGQHIRVVHRFSQKLDHRLETLERVVQQDVALAATARTSTLADAATAFRPASAGSKCGAKRSAGRHRSGRSTGSSRTRFTGPLTLYKRRPRADRTARSRKSLQRRLGAGTADHLQPDGTGRSAACSSPCAKPGASW